MELNKKEVIKLIKDLKKSGVKEEKYTEKIGKKFNVTKKHISDFYAFQTQKRAVNTQVVLLFLLGLILTTLGIASGSIAIFFGVLLVILSVLMIFENVKFKKTFKNLLDKEINSH